MTYGPDAASVRHGSLLLSLFSRRSFWGAVAGALVGVLVCRLGGMVAAILGMHGRAAMVVWPLDAGPGAWRGAFLGLLVGWLVHSRRQLWRAWLWAAAGCLAYEWLGLHFGPAYAVWRNVFDLGVALHLLLNTAIMSAGTFWVLEATRAPRPDPGAVPQPAEDAAEGAPEKEPAGEAARR